MLLSTYLHSTMLLLYLSRIRSTQVLWNIYIPLCFYFIGLQRWLQKCFTKFTFHYASTLSQGYFQPRPVRPNLHSTMLLLYRFWIWFIWCNLPIYIPLCFYFILCIHLHCRNLSYLHSTMLLLYPVPLFPFYFLQYGDTFCLPPFCIALLSKIFLLPLYKIWIFTSRNFLTSKLILFSRVKTKCSGFINR